MNQTKYPKRSQQPAGRERKRELTRHEEHQRKIRMVKVEAVKLCLMRGWINSVDAACFEFKISPVTFEELRDG